MAATRVWELFPGKGIYTTIDGYLSDACGNYLSYNQALGMVVSANPIETPILQAQFKGWLPDLAANAWALYQAEKLDQAGPSETVPANSSIPTSSLPS
jgi:hypothetical protein